MQRELLSQLQATQRSKQVLKIENQRFLIGKEEFVPLSAEMHYFRVNKRYWSYCFERIRKAGFRIVTTAVPWNLHESPPGSFDFSGNLDPRKDLIVFLELAREFGLKVILKPGPYIDSEWPRGGYPEYLLEMQDILARDSQGALVSLPDGQGSSAGRQPCLSHTRYRNQVRKYINNLCEIVKNYAFPKGPIFAIQLDHQTNQDGSPFSRDYNSEVVKNHYVQFLQKKYTDPRALRPFYREKWKSFEVAAPPAQIELKNQAELVKYFDWIEFQEEETGKYLKTLKEYFNENEISIIFFGNFRGHSEILPNISPTLLEESQIHPTGETFWPDDYSQLQRTLKFWGGKKFPWLSGFHCGNASSNPTQHRQYFPVTPVATKFLFTLALASGVKAFNFYMFVERDHWYDAPIGQDGSIQPNYEMVYRLVALNEKIPVNRLHSCAKVALALYRPYAWYRSLETRFPYDYFPELKEILAGISRDLSYLKIDYQVLDLETSDFQECDLIFIPSADFMSAEMQEKIVELIRSGKKVILYGLVPAFDLQFKKCQILAKYLKLKSTPAKEFTEVEGKEISFPARVIGHLKKGGRGSKEILWAGSKCVATRFAHGKGAAYFFSFDFTSHKNPRQLLYLEELLKENKIVPLGTVSDLEMDLKIQKCDNAYVLYLFNPVGSFWNPKASNKKEVVVKLDTKKLGLKGSLKLTELVNGEVIKTSANQLAGGMGFTLSEFESRIYLIGK